MKPILLLLSSASAAEFEVSCPKLICDDEGIGPELVENQCFKMRTEYTNEPIYARECFNKTASLASDPAFFCPFNIDSGDFSWIDETLMDDTKKDSQCKYQIISSIV